MGDIDVDAIEQQIKTLFADVPKPVNPAERIYYPVTDNDEPLIYIGKDKEVDTPIVDIYFKQDATPDSIKGNMAYLLQDYVLAAANMMLNERFSELAQSANPPFNMAYSTYNNFFLAKTKDAFNVGAYTKETGLKEALNVLLTELERVRRYGFTESEYARARANLLQELESNYNERDKTKNDKYVNEYIANFLDAEPIPGIEYEYTTYNQLAPSIPVEAVNLVIKEFITDNNQVIFIAAPDKEGVTVPSKEEVLAALKGMKDLDVQPYVDKVSNEPLMKEAPKGGSIVNEDSNGIYGTTELTLSNGIKVYLKKTDFKADEIRMRGFSVGGSSQFEDKDKLSFTSGVLNGVVEAGGAGNFSNVELTKMLAGKKVSVSAGVNGTEEYVQGNCSPKDFETMLQLAYLYTTAPRKDMEAFNSLKTRLKAQLESRGANPISTLLDTIQQEMYGASPRFLNLKPEMVDQLDYDRILELYKDRFADMGDFSFFFVGNIDIETAKPLIAQYLGSLPSAGRKETVIDRHMDIAKGNIENIFAKEQQTPMATVAMVISGTCQYDLKNNVLMSYLSQALDMVYTEEIREKEGGSYGVSTYGVMHKFPKEMVALQIIYQTDPAKFQGLNEIVNRELDKMATDGPSEEKMQKIKEYMLKKHNDNQKENSYWLNNLHEYFSTGVDNTQNYEALINGITAKDVQQFTANLLKQNNKITVVMTVPEE